MGLSIVITAIGSIPLAVLNWDVLQSMIYLFAPLQGIGNALMLNTGTALISDLLG